MPVLKYDAKRDGAIGERVRVFTVRAQAEQRRRGLRGFHLELWEPGRIIGLARVARIPFFNLSGYAEQPIYRVRLDRGEELDIGPLALKVEKEGL